MRKGGKEKVLGIRFHESEAYRYAVGAGPGATIGLGLETPEPDREAIRAPMRGRGGVGDMGMPGMGGGMGGVWPGGGPPGKQQEASLRLWTKVTLAY